MKKSHALTRKKKKNKRKKKNRKWGIERKEGLGGRLSEEGGGEGDEGVRAAKKGLNEIERARGRLPIGRE